MNDLKPVGEWMQPWDTNTGMLRVTWSDEYKPTAGDRLYAIPSTHRVVSVELLEKAADRLKDYAVTVKSELRAIIDNKE